MNSIKRYWLLFISLFCILLFGPSFSTFFTNDDFYFLNISRANNVSEFLEFFDPVNIYKGQSMYRPLTTQVFYFLGKLILQMNPFYMHITVFASFIFLVYLVYLLAFKISKNKDISILTAFLYATSATHFGHLFYFATFQEIGAAIFAFLSCILFIDYLDNKNKKLYFLSIIAFILGLLSKETAVVVPVIFLLIYFFIKKFDIRFIIPFALILGTYLFVRLRFYGVVTSDTYVWDFSGKILNTIVWYAAWSLNLPESFIDFIGPGFNVNPNLFKYWRNEAVLILSTFVALAISLSILFIKDVKHILRKNINVYIFSLAIFILGIGPVVFLPIHKFSYYLTISLFGVSLAISYILNRNKTYAKVIVLSLWVLGSYFNISYSLDTSWITRGAEISSRVKNYFDKVNLSSEVSYVYFTDTARDVDLPWSPTEVVYNAISKEDFFEVYYPNKFIITSTIDHQMHHNLIQVESRQFLGY